MQAAGFALIAATIFTLFKWAGLRDFREGWLSPVAFSDVWRIFPTVAAFIFVSYVLWPFRHPFE